MSSRPLLHHLSLLLLLLFLFLLSHTNCYTPYVNYLIDCGAYNHTHLNDGRTFKSDRQTTSLLSTTEDIQASNHSPIAITMPSFVPPSSLPLFQTARIFADESTYTFYISRTGGRIWIRLYFYALPHPSYDLATASFSVHTNHFVLLHEFSPRNNDNLVFKEYLVTVFENRFSLKFKPIKNSFAFINAIEVVSAPDTLISDSATAVSPHGEFKGLQQSEFQVLYRVNVGGAIIAPNNDTLTRTWEPDDTYNANPNGSVNVAVPYKGIKYPEFGGADLIAPSLVYATAVQIKDHKDMQFQSKVNLSWMMNVENSYSYLIRLHFCDIVSKSLNQLVFSVYINGMVGVPDLDLSSQTRELATAFYQDFVLNASAVENGFIFVQVEPEDLQLGTSNAILNGIEIMKMINSANSFDGLFSVDGDYKEQSFPPNAEMRTLAFVGLVLALIGLVLLLMTCVQMSKSTKSWEVQAGFTWWMIHPFYSRSFSRVRSPRKGPKRFFHLSELQRATNNFEESRVIGVGGYGKVYLGRLKEDNMNVAIKRANGGSGQGLKEFRTELDMLSELRHRHLVSLIGYCDENSEMILVYEYMANGSFRSHLYGANLRPLSWKQRLEICIGAARGLYYLHTGAAQSIIHRDVKTTNILLDENYVAKVSDFGLSKTVPNKAYVSTAVKGSFGYLDPEYFRKLKLTQKSDVYSFGVVLLEALCGRPVIWTCPNSTQQVSLVDWVMERCKRGMVHEVVDPSILESINPKSLKMFVGAAKRCLEDHGADRPSIGDVLWHLECALQLQEGASHVDAPEYNLSGKNLICSQQGGQNGNCDVVDNDIDNADNLGDIKDVNAALFSQIANLQGR
ncbi:probable receptor-like protein kinase At5g61350 [Arachis duranensis]|uniref:Probable receptor-like protein kinase At5g61350 n=1 Tax=Arachis duranensis TaxID=130453 RepID=A0A6P4BYF2_ARADU|nr:probable receptor-like protein kinase At5g61350 [Arachis duranensis]